ncbi:MAG: TolC family protein, partial [Planctomycetota bacterium]
MFDSTDPCDPESPQHSDNRHQGPEPSHAVTGSDVGMIVQHRGTIAMILLRWLAFAAIWLAGYASLHAQPNEPVMSVLPEARRLRFRSPEQLRPAPLTTSPRPATVSDPMLDAPPYLLSLNEAINQTLRNSEVVRVLGGVAASSTGRTIYDTSISNTQIDVQRGAFDPTVRLNNQWTQSESPSASRDPLDPNNAIFGGIQSEGYNLDFGLTKRNQAGGTAAMNLRVNERQNSSGTFALNSSANTATEFSYTQPLLRGAGVDVNNAPIVLARIDTERSYFQYKSAVQQSVQSVVSGYWSLMAARTDLWARQQQLEQAQFAVDQAKSRVEVGDANAGELAQAELALENFRASLLTAQASTLQRQGALLNVMGLPPFEPMRTTPITPPLKERLPVDWEAINSLASIQRPDIIELKLVLEADRQRLMLADNQALPQL